MTFRLFLVIFLVTGVTTTSAQGLGNPTRGTRAFNPRPNQVPTGDPVKPDSNVLSIERSDMYQKMLGIDVFTKEVLKSYLKDYYAATIDISYNKDLKFEDKSEKINIERKKFEASLKEVFTEEQVEKILTEEEFGKETKKFEKEKRQEKRKKKKRKKKDDGN